MPITCDFMTPTAPAKVDAQASPAPGGTRPEAPRCRTFQNRRPRQRVALVTGASGGLGRAIAEHLAASGYQVFAASRRVDSWTQAGQPPPRIVPVVMDVTDGPSVEAAIAHILRETDTIDLLVNNAGFGVAGAIEETPLDAARAQLETNFFGTVRVCQAVLPMMRQQGGGSIVNITSVGGRLGLPFQGYYSASKFALEGLTEALRYEMAPFGVRVSALAPGNFKTDFDQHRRVFGLTDASPYAERGRRALEGMASDEAHGAAPSAAAHAVQQLAESRWPPLRRSVGPWFERFGLLASSFLPRSLFDWGYKKVMRV